MYLASLYIRGYRSIEELYLPFKPGKNVLLGKNNAGKSSIVGALNLVLGERFPTYAEVSSEDFFQAHGQEADEILIACELAGDDCDWDSLKRIRGVWSTSSELDIEPLSKDDEGIHVEDSELFFDADFLTRGEKEYIRGPALANLVSALKGAGSFYFFLRVRRETTYSEDFDKDFRFAYKDASGKWRVLWGINAEFRGAFITSAILPSFREPGSQLRINNWSWYGKLIRTAWDDARALDSTLQENLSELLEAVKQTGEPVYGALSQHINTTVRVGFADTSVRLQFVATSIPDVHKNVQVYADDGLDAPITQKGSGLQSAVIIGLFSYYCRMHHKNTTLLVVEEPEVFLHPHARRSIAKRLDEFVQLNAEDGKVNQVIVTSHSADLVQSGDAATVTVVRKVDGATTARTVDLDSLGPKEVQKVARATSAEMFFADLVILCEGAEEYLLPRVADLLAGVPGFLDETNVSVVRVDGKGQFRVFTEVLDELGIAWRVLADLDALTSIVGRFIGPGHALDPDFQRIRQRVTDLKDPARTQTKLARTLGTKGSTDRAAFVEEMIAFRESGGTLPTTELFAIWDHMDLQVSTKLGREDVESDPALKTDLHAFLERLFRETGIWLLRFGELEDYAKPEARELGLFVGGKLNDARLLEFCRDDEQDISTVFLLEEFQDFLKRSLGLEGPSVDETEAMETLA